MTTGRIMVPVAASVTLRNTVAYAVREAMDHEDPAVHFVAPVVWRELQGDPNQPRAETERLLDRITVWAREDARGITSERTRPARHEPAVDDHDHDHAAAPAADADPGIEIETAIVGATEYLFGPDDYARVLAEYAQRHDIERVIVDPEYSPGGNVPMLQPMETDLANAGLTVEEAPVERATRRGRLLRRGGALQLLTLFAISFAFYQLVGGPAFDSFDLATGAASAGIVAVMLHRISFSDRPHLPTLIKRSLRLVVYAPYLLYEIIKANLYVSYVILHPDLPIEPRTVEVQTAVWGGMPVATLANSITLTPGTLTVRAYGHDLVVHTLIPSAREGLLDGALERAVRFVFYGRAAARIASPRERGDYRILERVTGEDRVAEPDPDGESP